jgi:orotate phosphoribosyltransferase
VTDEELSAVARPTDPAEFPPPPDVLGTAAEREETAAYVEQLFRRAGALREGHFELKSGRHGDRYLEKFQVLQHPPIVSELCRLIADRVWQPGAEASVDVVCGPTTGGVILAFEVARQLGVRGIFAEQVRDASGATRREFRRGFRIEPGQRVLLVDDIVTTGASLVEMLEPIESMGGELVLAAVLVARSGGLGQLTSPRGGRSYRAEALWTLDLPTYEPGPETCPGCRVRTPLETPGSAGAITAR